MIVRPTNVCTACHNPIRVGDFVHEVWVFEDAQYGVPRTAGPPEAAHADCAAPRRTWAHQTIKHHALKMDVNMGKPELAPSHQCKHCGEPFRRGDRIFELICVEGVAFDRATGAPGIRASGQAEYAHVKCDDRELVKGRDLGVLSS